MNKKKQRREMNRIIRRFRKELQTDKWFDGRFRIQEIQMGDGRDELVFKRYLFMYGDGKRFVMEESQWVNMFDIRREILSAYNKFIMEKCGYTGPIATISEAIMEEYSEAYKELAK
jgi:hypothetical protein